MSQYCFPTNKSRFQSCTENRRILNNFVKMALSPKESGEFIVKNAKYLTVVEEGIKNVANQVSLGDKF